MEPSSADSDPAPTVDGAESNVLSAKEKQRLKMEEKKKLAGQSKGKKAGKTENTSSSSSAKPQAKKSGSKSKNSKAGKSQQKAKEKEAIRKEQARKNFNLHYSKQFGEKRWQKLLFALEGPTRYCCLVNKYAPQPLVDVALDPMRSRLEKLSFLHMNAYAVKQEKMDLDAPPKMEDLLPFPQPAKDEETGVFNYYLLDAASLLAVEALDVKPNDTVLDLCAAPGGKSLAILQKLKLGEGSVGSLTANELSMERRKRLKGVIHGYLPHNLHTCVTISGKDATQWHLTEGNHYDKVLVDAPCSSDRHVLHDAAEMSIWTASRSRLNAKRQLDILLSALRAVRVGGTVVYATCALNQTENDDVIEKAQKKSRALFEVDTMKKWPIGEATKFGWIVLPDSGNQGWGPLYFAVLKRMPGEREPANRRREMDDEDDEDHDDEDSDEDGDEEIAELGADEEEDEETD